MCPSVVVVGSGVSTAEGPKFPKGPEQGSVQAAIQIGHPFTNHPVGVDRFCRLQYFCFAEFIGPATVRVNHLHPPHQLCSVRDGEQVLEPLPSSGDAIAVGHSGSPFIVLFERGHVSVRGGGWQWCEYWISGGGLLPQGNHLALQPVALSHVPIKELLSLRGAQISRFC